MKLKLIPLLLAGTALVAGCQQNANTVGAPTILKEDAAASVNGQFISKTALEALTKEVSARAQGQVIPKDKLVDELVKRELLIQEAKTKGLDKSAEIIERLEMMKGALLSQAAIEDYIKANPITEADLKAEYDKQIGMAGGGAEYKARHILVKTEEEAKELIVKLDKGGDFAELATTKSIDPSAKTQGGDLGWFSAAQMVAPFSEAVAKLENGKYTMAPVKTQFGWHVILREDSRQQTPPPFEAVKAQLEPMVQREKLTNYLDALRKGAQVEILVPLTEEVPAEVVETVEVTESADGKTAEVVETVEVIEPTDNKEATKEAK
ncbi:MAG: peptidylprolyl isomerase [Methylococcaceae bacterium]|nr:peptidylprolyl isomerase [Methylococcaceae bacterium]